MEKHKKGELTPIQQLMNKIQELHPELFLVYTHEGRNFMHECTPFLDIEKKHIIKAFEEGTKLKDCDSELNASFNAVYYYVETYQ